MIDCVEVVSKIKEHLKTLDYADKCLAIIQVGDNPASNNYVRGKLADCEEINLNHKLIKLEHDSSFEEVSNVIKDINLNKEFTGCILQLPLPKHLQEHEATLTNMIAIEKDVDGFRKESKFVPCTPLGVLMLLNELNIDLSDKTVTIIGRGKLVGKPLAELLISKVGTLNICTSKTSNELKSLYLSQSDVIVTCVGKYGSLNLELLKENSKNPIIIDCGIDVIDKKQFGDTDIAVYEVNENVTPRVKGMGLLTRIALLSNVIE